MKKAQPPDKTILSTAKAKITYHHILKKLQIIIFLPRKNFRPNLSIITIVQMFPGKAEMDIKKESVKTLASGTGLLQNSSSTLVEFDL